MAPRARQARRSPCQLLLYPVTDFDFETASYRENAEGYLLTTGAMQLVLGRTTSARRPAETDAIRAPRRAPTNLAGLPPGASWSPPSSTRCATKARPTRRSCAPPACTVTSKRYDGMLHGFAWTLGATPTGAVLINDLATAFRGALDGARS